jgi:ribosomal protein L36
MRLQAPVSRLDENASVIRRKLKGKVPVLCRLELLQMTVRLEC